MESVWLNIHEALAYIYQQFAKKKGQKPPIKYYKSNSKVALYSKSSKFYATCDQNATDIIIMLTWEIAHTFAAAVHKATRVWVPVQGLGFFSSQHHLNC